MRHKEPSVWCANAASFEHHPEPPWGIGVPGFSGGSEGWGDLCESCQAKVNALLAEPLPRAEATETAREQVPVT